MAERALTPPGAAQLEGDGRATGYFDDLAEGEKLSLVVNQLELICGQRSVAR